MERGADGLKGKTRRQKPRCAVCRRLNARYVEVQSGRPLCTQCYGHMEPKPLVRDV